LADFGEEILLAARLEKGFELHRDVEVILDRVLSASGAQDDVVDPGCDRLLDAVLNDRFVDQRQHFLGLRFGGGQETGSESSGGKGGLAGDGGPKFSPICSAEE